MNFDRFSRALFPWFALGENVPVWLLWAFRFVWGVIFLIWCTSSSPSREGLLSLLVLFFLIGSTAGFGGASRAAVFSLFFVFALSLIFINGASDFEVFAVFFDLLSGGRVELLMGVRAAALLLVSIVFSGLWWRLIKCW